MRAQTQFLPISYAFNSDTLENSSTSVQPQNSLGKKPVFAQKESAKKHLFLPASESFFTLDSTIHSRIAAGLFYSTSYKKCSIKAQGLLGAYNSVLSSQPFIAKYRRFGGYMEDLRFRSQYSVSKAIDIQAGIDNHFFGDGYRSLIQSAQSNPLPFFHIRAKLGVFRYGLLYQLLHEETPSSKRKGKFSASHYLSFSPGKKWNISLIEQVFFAAKDGNLSRGFELEYLNPFVFFRTQEYSLGSADNVLLSLNAHYRSEKWMLYTQVNIDELVVKELRARSKWWANKYAFQLGIKGKKQKLSYLFEMNIVRPYMYTHLSGNQNVGVLGTPLAHPEGANFIEVLSNEEFQLSEKLQLSMYGQFLLKGLDEMGKNWGSEIYKNYITYEKEYQNTIGQGVTVRKYQVGFQINYWLKKVGLNAYFQSGVLHQQFDEVSKTNFYFSTGIRSSFFQVRSLF